MVLQQYEQRMSRMICTSRVSSQPFSSPLPSLMKPSSGSRALTQAMWWTARGWAVTTNWAPQWRSTVKQAMCSRATPPSHASWGMMAGLVGIGPCPAVRVFCKFKERECVCVCLLGGFLIIVVNVLDQGVNTGWRSGSSEVFHQIMHLKKKRSISVKCVKKLVIVQ